MDEPTSSTRPLRFCPSCIRQVSGDASGVEAAETDFGCDYCLGILHPNFINEVASYVKGMLAECPYDSKSFILALNLPTSQVIRETVFSKSRPDFNGLLISVPFKLRNINAYLESLHNASGLSPTLSSELQLTVTFENDEFDAADAEFLRKNFRDQFSNKRKHQQNGNDEKLISKGQLLNLLPRISTEIAKSYVVRTPTQRCTISAAFERDPVCIAGRYCKYSRALPQSPWTGEDGGKPIPGNSVSEKVCDVLKRTFLTDSTRFVTSGREDIDVRMLGDGRPFVVFMLNARKTASLGKNSAEETLKNVEDEINKNVDIRVLRLQRVTRDQADQLSVGEEEKRKWYTAYCHSTDKLDPQTFDEKVKKQAAPFDVVQRTPVRVLKRRALMDRTRTIFTFEAFYLDAHHFMLRLETQAGTYVKEFVCGDFGRTRPSVADILGVEEGEVSILELDVERVDVDWPPPIPLK